MNLAIHNLENAEPEQLSALLELIEDMYHPVCKAVRTPSGETMPEAFEEWFLNQLSQRTTRQFNTARRQIWHVVENYLRQHGGTFANLSPAQLGELERVMFEAGLAHTSHMVGIPVDAALERRLMRYGWTRQEILDFPGLAYRFALIRRAIETRRGLSFEELIRLAMAHPLTDAERQAVQHSRTDALNLLMPVYDKTGRLIRRRALDREKDLLRGMIVQGIERHIHPLALAREMYGAEEGRNIFRDFERIARTEIANAYASGAFRADRISGKLKNNDRVYRITRPNACKICLALYTNPDGTPRLYRVSDLENGTTPEIDVGVRKERLYRAVIGATHPNEMCSDWQKYWGEITDQLFEMNRVPYQQGRSQVGLPVTGTVPPPTHQPPLPTGTEPIYF